MRESTTPCAGGASRCADNEGTSLDDILAIGDEQGVKMGTRLKYDSCKSRVKVTGGVDVVVGETNVPKEIEATTGGVDVSSILRFGIGLQLKLFLFLFFIRLPFDLFFIFIILIFIHDAIPPANVYLF
ncbi:hypothetical protein M9H77_02924 [Catharanthus roseus]|uniref:Uncharacterized protein n=1 Tax=Catharanthus roseus TaxID=4058 RepID=A0ACC0C9U4_CATRO|nr:hypothetical protein M9H77_02924 [Catharanthus roseus]